MTRRMLPIPAVAAALAILCGAGMAMSLYAGDAEVTRLLVVMRDRSRSYCCLQEANRKLIKVIHALGPNDGAVIIDINADFSPRRNVRVVARFPSLAASTSHRRAANGTKECLADVVGTINRLERQKLQIIDFLNKPEENPPDGTDFWPALEYAARLLRDSPATEKHLVVFSDLEHDSGNVRSAAPPRAVFNMRGARVTALFVPYDEMWERRAASWRSWFQTGGATEFTMEDGAQSPLHQVISPSPFLLPGFVEKICTQAKTPR